MKEHFPLLERAVLDAVERHCRAKGFKPGPGVNNPVPHNGVAAFGMAKLLASNGYDQFVSVAPEGHMYSYFLEVLGMPVASISVDYPPTRCSATDDLSNIKGARVLVVEDDIRSGQTLRLLVEYLAPRMPRSLSLYLGHSKGCQILENLPPEFTEVLLAEDRLDLADPALEEEFVRFFMNKGVLLRGSTG